MSVIIRLQNLPWSANALDIRQYFQGLSIPEGGVHIVGGELGDAFIAFSTDEDARQAFMRNDGKIKEVQIKLMLSSRTEMQKVIEAARSQSLAAFMPASVQAALPAAVPTVLPAAVPDVPGGKDREARSREREKKRSRSRSRDRKDRSRDRDRRDRRHRDRSRSKSREKKDRRRRERSRSRDRTRSRDRDRRGGRAGGLGGALKDQKPAVWDVPIIKPDGIEEPKAAAGLLGGFVPSLTMEEAQRSLTALTAAAGILGDRGALQTQREGWIANNRDFPRADIQAPLLGNDFIQRGFHQNRNVGAFGVNNTFNKGPMNRFNANCCVEMRGFYGAYSDVRRFFQGLFINNTGIKFVDNGVAYVRFAYPEGKQQALQRDGAPFRNNSVQVLHLDDEVFEQCAPSNGRSSRSQQEHMQEEDSSFRNRNMSKSFNNSAPLPKVFNCLLIEDLPSFAKEQDILRMFSDYPLMSILLINKHRHHRVAYAKFGKAEDAKAALEETAKHVIEGKPVLVKPCREEDFEAAEAEQNEGDEQATDNSSKDCDTDCVVLNDLPLKTNDRDVSDFFSDIGIIPVKVHLMSNHLGFTGTAYCEFASNEDAGAALEKDGVPLGSNVVSVKPVQRQEMESLLGTAVPAQNFPQMQPAHRPPFFPRNSFGMGMRPGFMGPRLPMRRFQKPMPPHMQDPPGCTVLMENVPYKAGLDEILEFFEGFDIRSDNVLRRFNDNGTPSGEAKVYFNSPEEALQAVQQKRGHKIRERTIYLTHC